MDAGTVRDFAIVISGGLILVLMIVAIILGLMLYREIKKLTTSIKDTINMAKAATKEVKEAIKNSKWLINEIRGKKTEEANKS